MLFALMPVMELRATATVMPLLVAYLVTPGEACAASSVAAGRREVTV